MIIRAAAETELPWLAARTGLSVNGDFRGIVAIDAHRRIYGMVGYDKWTHTAARIHIAMDVPVRAFVQAAFEYPFVQAGKDILLAEIAAGNKKSRRLANRFGFHEIYRIRDGWRVGEDLIVLELRKHSWQGRKYA